MDAKHYICTALSTQCWLLECWPTPLLEAKVKFTAHGPFSRGYSNDNYGDMHMTIIAHGSNEIHTCAVVAEAGPYVVDIRSSHRDATCMLCRTEYWFTCKINTHALYQFELAGDVLQASSSLFPAAQTICKPCAHKKKNKQNKTNSNLAWCYNIIMMMV